MNNNKTEVTVFGDLSLTLLDDSGFVVWVGKDYRYSIKFIFTNNN
jgi:hypothetical protein